jgi:plasmid stability protein
MLAMRTTIDLPDSLLKHLKARAALEGRSLRDLVVELVEKGLSARDAVDPQQRFAARPPVLPSQGPLAVDLGRASSADLQALLSQDDDEQAAEFLARR